jgi:hypothetical protein
MTLTRWQLYHHLAHAMMRVRNAGMDMMMYERYIDDSNQVAVVPPPGSCYDVANKQLVIDVELAVRDGDENERLSRVLKCIAKDVHGDIQMEDDHPGRHQNRKMPILDLEVWMNEDGFLLYQHYQKPMASTKVMHSQSAQSLQCKRSLHTQEILRRLLNCSSRLNWEGDVAPVVTEYMGRMAVAGYTKKFRKNTLERSIRIYDQMVKDDQDGIKPIFRPKDWQKVERRKAREAKKHSWSSKGGFVAPIFVPPTPNGELAARLRKIAATEAEAGVNFRIVETGGRSVTKMG